MMARRQTIDPLVRAKVIETWGNACWLRLPGCTGVGEEDDHIVPYAHGGMDTVANIRRACKHCNASRQDRVLYGYGARLHIVVTPPGSCDREAVEWVEGSQAARRPGCVVAGVGPGHAPTGVAQHGAAAGGCHGVVRSLSPVRHNAGAY